MLVSRAFNKAAPQLPVVYLSDGSEAVAYLDACQDVPALLLTDLNMPLVSGLELLIHIRQRSAARLMPTVVLATSTADADRQRCCQAGATTYLIKPISLTDYPELVTNLVDCRVFSLAE